MSDAINRPPEKANPQTELQRLVNNLDEQDKVINLLDEKLSPVLGRTPAEPSKDSHEGPTHISTIADRVAEHTYRINELLNQLLT